MDWDEICQVNVGAATVKEQLIWDEYLLRAQHPDMGSP